MEFSFLPYGHYIPHFSSSLWIYHPFPNLISTAMYWNVLLLLCSFLKVVEEAFYEATKKILFAFSFLLRCSFTLHPRTYTRTDHWLLLVLHNFDPNASAILHSTVLHLIFLLCCHPVWAFPHLFTFSTSLLNCICLFQDPFQIQTRAVPPHWIWFADVMGALSFMKLLVQIRNSSWDPLKFQYVLQCWQWIHLGAWSAHTLSCRGVFSFSVLDYSDIRCLLILQL